MVGQLIRRFRDAGGRGVLRLSREERGATIFMFAFFVMVTMAVGAVALDYGDLVVERRDHQKSVDSIALASVQELPEDTLLADQYGREWGLRNGVADSEIVNLTLDSTCWNDDPDDDPAQIDSVTADVSRAGRLFFLSEFGFSVDVGAHAKACAGSLVETTGLRPWSVSILNSECFSLKLGGNANDVRDYTPNYGERCVIRLESPSSKVGSVRLGEDPGDDCSPPGGGASGYAENIVEGADGRCAIGDIVGTQPGLDVGPTFKAVEDLLALEGACDSLYGNSNGYDELLEVFTAPGGVTPGPSTLFSPRDCGWDSDIGTPDSPRFVSLILIDKFEKLTGFETEPIVAFAGFLIEGCEVLEKDGGVTLYPRCDMKNSDRTNAQIIGTFVQHLRIGGSGGVLNPFGIRTYTLVE